MVKSKVRFDGVDVTAMVSSLNRLLLGRRVINIYNGANGETYIFKLDGTPKQQLVLESGIRFHTTSSTATASMPSPFCSKLRKHLRGLRLEKIVQLGEGDRVVHLMLGTGEQRHSILLELYARGNLVLTNARYEILAALRTHEYQQEEGVRVQVGQVYPVTFAARLSNEALTGRTASEACQWAHERVSSQPPHEATKKKAKATTLKSLLLHPSSGVSHLGPSLLEHCILYANLDPNLVVDDIACNEEWISKWERLLEALQQEGIKAMEGLKMGEAKGYLLYRTKPNADEEPPDDRVPHADKVLEEFQPHLLKQHEGRPHLTFDTFPEAVDEFFSHLQGQKQALRAEAAEAAARNKLAKIQQDQQQRLDALLAEQEVLKEHAKLVELHADPVDKALMVINSALDTGMDWEQLEELVRVEQEQDNPIAKLIVKLQLEQDQMVLRLPKNDGADEETSLDVTISLHETAFGNANALFAKYRASKDKSQKTMEASTKALKAAEASAKRQLEEAQRRTQQSNTLQARRKAHWFEKFHWFVTSDNYLVLGGRDAQQNELLVKRYLRPGDAYLHADVHGAASCILRAKRRRRQTDSTTVLVPLSDRALREAGNFTICRSSAWTSKMVTSAWWVESHQVSKTAPTGEYLTVGSFMIRGKKNYLPPTQLEMGLAVLFRLGDDDSIARHQNDRRDFALMELMEHEEDELDLPPAKGVTIVQANEEPDNDDDKVETPPVAPAKAVNHEKEVSRDQDDREDENDNKHSSEGDTGQREEITEKKATKAKGKRKGLSVRERKLIRKYGSLEAAEKATAAQRPENGGKQEEVDQSSDPGASDAGSQQPSMKRGKRSKMKRAMKKYGRQDEEERELAMLALQGGEKSKKQDKSGKESETETQQKAAADTVALLVKDAEKVAAGLPELVRETLAECVKVGSENQTSRWDKFDADVLEQLLDFDSEEEMLAAAKRLLYLKKNTRVDNFSSSLAGILRTIRKYGHENLNAKTDDTAPDAPKRKTKEEKKAEEMAWKQALAEEGIVDEALDDAAVDDTLELSRLTGKPLSEDSLMYAVPVCGPYQTLSKYSFRVKLTPGNMKRGKAAKQCLEVMLKFDGPKSPEAERLRELIKRVGDNEWMQAICPDVKIATAGSSKAIKKQKANKKKGKGG